MTGRIAHRAPLRPRRRSRAGRLVVGWLVAGLTGWANGCGDSAQPPRMLQGSAEAPNLVLVLLPEDDLSALRDAVAARESWHALEEEVLALAEPERFPQPVLPPETLALARRASRDLFDPIEGLDPVFDPALARDERVVALVAVELLPAATIETLHGSDAFTEAFHDLDRYLIRRAVVRLPDWLAGRPADDFANFLAHELGHALGLEGHIDEMGSHPDDATWFWDRLMTVPIRPGQRWQPATTEDVFAIAEGRYRLRDGWMEGRDARFPEAPPHPRGRTPIR